MEPPRRTGAYHRGRPPSEPIPRPMPASGARVTTLHGVMCRDYRGFLVSEQVDQFVRFLKGQLFQFCSTCPMNTEFVFRFSRSTTTKNQNTPWKICAPFFSGWCSAKMAHPQHIHLQIISPFPESKTVFQGPFTKSKASISYTAFLGMNGFLICESKAETVLTVAKDKTGGDSHNVFARRRGYFYHKLMSELFPTRVAPEPKNYPEARTGSCVKQEYEHNFYPTSCGEFFLHARCLKLNNTGSKRIQLPLANLFKGLMFVVETLKEFHAQGYVHCNLYNGNIFIDALNQENWKVRFAGFENMAMTGQIGDPSDNPCLDTGCKEYGIITPFTDIYALGILFGVLLLRDDFVEFIQDRSKIITTNNFDIKVFAYARSLALKVLPAIKATSLEDLIVEVTQESSWDCEDASMVEELDILLRKLILISELKNLITSIFEADHELQESLENEGEMLQKAHAEDLQSKCEGINFLYANMPRAEDILATCQKILRNYAFRPTP